MATKQTSLVDVNEEDCISIEVVPVSDSFSHSIGSQSPLQNEESEFQKEKSFTNSHVDNFFNKGNPLPFDQSPRLKMVQKEINTNATLNRVRSYSTLERIITPFTTDLRLPSTNDTYNLGSCSFSSYEAYQSEFLFERFSERFGFEVDVDVDVTKKNWFQKLKDAKQFWPSQRLKTSRGYLKSFFTKSKCNDSHIDNNKKFGSINHNTNTNMHEDHSKNHTQRSFLSMFQRRCSAKASSLSRTSSKFSSYVEVERSIEEAIAYCKQSLKQCGNQEKIALDKAEPKGE